jgi:hypothetical protein
MADQEVQSLKLMVGGDRSNLYEIRDGESLTLGRDPVCTVQINHASVSPIHCRLEYRDGILSVTDLDSQEGVLYANKRLRHFELKEDATFSIGELEIATSRSPAIVFTPAAKEVKRRITFSEMLPHAAKKLIHRRKKSLPLGQRLDRLLRRNLPFLGISLILHLVLWFMLADIPFITKRLDMVRQIVAQILTREDQVFLEEEMEPEEVTFDDPFVPDQESFEPMEDRFLEEEIPREIPDRSDEIAIRGLGGGGLATGLAGEGVARLTGPAYSDGFEKFITDLRTDGMDVTFVIDSTSSMVPFIDEARRVVNELINKLAAIVPNLRLAIVTYRDRGDEYITRHLDLTNDRYEILTFLEGCKAEGGGDFPEAIYEALYRAVETLYWRAEARKVIILVGDAPYHQDDCPKIDRLLNAFCSKENKGVVNAVYVGPPEDSPGGDYKTAISCMQHITQVASGEFAKVDDYENIIKHLFYLAFGTQWKNDISRLLATVKKNKSTRIVERRADGGQKEWLLDALKNTPVNSGIVNALIETADARDMEVMVTYLESGKVAVETKWAVVYILMKRLNRQIEFDPYASRAAQAQEIQRIREAISRL